MNTRIAHAPAGVVPVQRSNKALHTGGVEIGCRQGISGPNQHEGFHCGSSGSKTPVNRMEKRVSLSAVKLGQDSGESRMGWPCRSQQERTAKW